MKNLKRAIAHFIIDGNDSWGKISLQDKYYLAMLGGFGPGISGYGIVCSQDQLGNAEKEIRKLIPCFFEGED